MDEDIVNGLKEELARFPLTDALWNQLRLDSWIVQVFAVVLVTATIDFVVSRIVARIVRQAERSKTVWDDVFFKAVSRPLRALVWILGMSVAIAIARDGYESALLDLALSFRDVAVIVVIAWFLSRFVKFGQEEIVADKRARGQDFDLTTYDAVAKLLRVSIFITSGLVVLQSLGYSISGVLAFGGIGGIAVGFAARDLLANFFGGLMIYLDRPFQLGDWVRSPDREMEGTVEKIGWRLTVIRTFDKRPLYLPNAVFNQVAVENPSRMYNRRIYETIGIRYDDAAKMADIVADVKEMLLGHDEIDTNQTLIVNFNAFAASSLDFFVYTFTKTTNWVKYHEVKQDVLIRILEIIDRHGAEVAFPTSTIHLADSAPVPEPDVEPSGQLSGPRSDTARPADTGTGRGYGQVADSDGDGESA